jgi:arylsulfatase A-like enzyme
VKTRRLAAGTWVLALGLSLACNNKSKPEPGPPPSASLKSPAPAVSSVAPPKALPKRPAGPLNVLFITVDSLRADMPWHGYERPIAPNLTKLAERAVVYENHRSISSYTAQTVACWLSGRPASTLYRTGFFFTGYHENNLFFPEVLKEKGIRSVGLHAHMYFGKGKGLEQGFDVFETVKGITFDSQTDNHVTSEKVTTRLIELLGDKTNTGKQFFAWAHYMDPHDQYIKHKESPDFGNGARDRYDSEVWFTDYWIGKLLEFAKKQPWYENTALVITSDHGEAFGEHSMYRHAFDIWDVLVRVPLLIVAPGADPQRIKEPRTHIDIAPTLMDLMGQEPLEGFLGKSLVPEVYGAEPPQSREPLTLELAEDSNNPHRRALVKGDYKLIVYDTGWQKLLFNLKDDPGEEKNLSKSEPEKLAEMLELFEKTFAAIPSIRPYSGNKLKSGKLANGPVGPPKAEPE